MKWITREKVKVDRVACPWLIKRFVDSNPEFIFVPAEQVETKARDLGATPYNIDGCLLWNSSHWQRGRSMTNHKTPNGRHAFKAGSNKRNE